MTRCKDRRKAMIIPIKKGRELAGKIQKQI
jgi:hypothetical protein